ncbi:MAG: YidC/Oxa1 family membrane protein insertase [Oscillospiraceae bacterium]|nr:YidC/Oxa1 family membrane protein insertase [Oscillospiraceae bacterium]
MGFFIDIIATPLGWLMWFIYQGIPNYGAALIIFAIVTRTAQFPLGIKQHKSSIKMAAFRPRLDELKKKYGNNKQKYNEEMQKMMSQEGYKPLGGCLPQLVPFVLLFGLLEVVYKPLTYIVRITAELKDSAVEVANSLGAEFLENLLGSNALKDGAINVGNRLLDLNLIKLFNNSEAVELMKGNGHVEFVENFTDKIGRIDLSFFWIPGTDLSVIPTLAFNLLILVPIIAGAVTFMSTMLTMRISPTAQLGDQSGSGMMKGMTYIMPLLTVWMSFMFPVGLSLYWMIGGALGVVQAIILNKMYNPKELIAKEQEAMKARRKPSKKKVIYAETEEDVDNGGDINENTDDENADNKKRTPEQISAKEYEKRRIAEARKKLEETYGDDDVESGDNIKYNTKPKGKYNKNPKNKNLK